MLKQTSILAILAMVLLAEPVHAQADKRDHFAIELMLGVGASRLYDDRVTAFGVAMVPGIVKELTDSRQAGNRFSVKDLVWDAAGAAIGVNLGHWMLTRSGGVTQVSYRQEF